MLRSAHQRDWAYSVGIWAASRLVQACGTTLWALTHGYSWSKIPWLAVVWTEVHDDSAWYAWIAQDGYVPQDTVFFPAYPLLVRLVHALSGLSVVSAGLIVSNICMIISCYVLLRLLRRYMQDRTARLAVALWALWPSGIYLTSMYTESLFIAAFWGSIWALERERWTAAGILGAVAALTRNTGLLLEIAWLQVLLRAYREDRRLPWRQIGAASLAPLSVGAYCVYLWVRWGDPLAWSHYQAIWGRVPMNPLETLVRGLLAAPRLIGESGVYAHLYFGLEYASVLLVLLLLIGVWKHFPRPWFWITVVMILAPLSAPGLGVSAMTPTPHRIEDYYFSFFRYCLTMIPIYAALACRMKWALVWRTGIAVSASGLSLVSMAISGRWFLA